jgi:hypothetical protein
MNRTARIFKLGKTATQSGMSKSHDWMLKFDQTSARQIEGLMGWTSSSDTMQQLNLHFPTLEEAVAYAKRNSVIYRIEAPQEVRRRIAAYSDNFKFNRTMPWSH